MRSDKVAEAQTALNFEPQMHTYLSVVLAFALPVTVCGQFDYGISAGGVLTELHAKDSDYPRLTSSVGDVSRTAFSASVFYRERYSEFVTLVSISQLCIAPSMLPIVMAD